MFLILNFSMLNSNLLNFFSYISPFARCMQNEFYYFYQCTNSVIGNFDFLRHYTMSKIVKLRTKPVKSVFFSLQKLIIYSLVWLSEIEFTYSFGRFGPRTRPTRKVPESAHPSVHTWHRNSAAWTMAGLVSKLNTFPHSIQGSQGPEISPIGQRVTVVRAQRSAL